MRNGLIRVCANHALEIKGGATHNPKMTARLGKINIGTAKCENGSIGQKLVLLIHLGNSASHLKFDHSFDARITRVCVCMNFARHITHNIVLLFTR